MFRSSSPPLHIEHRLFNIHLIFLNKQKFAVRAEFVNSEEADRKYIYIYHYANDRSWLYIRKFTTFRNNKYLSNLNSHQFTFKNVEKRQRDNDAENWKKKHSTTTRKSKINKMRFSYLKIIKNTRFQNSNRFWKLAYYFKAEIQCNTDNLLFLYQ